MGLRTALSTPSASPATSSPSTPAVVRFCTPGACLLLSNVVAQSNQSTYSFKPFLIFLCFFCGIQPPLLRLDSLMCAWLSTCCRPIPLARFRLSILPLPPSSPLTTSPDITQRYAYAVTTSHTCWRMDTFPFQFISSIQFIVVDSRENVESTRERFISNQRQTIESNPSKRIGIKGIMEEEDEWHSIDSLRSYRYSLYKTSEFHSRWSRQSTLRPRRIRQFDPLPHFQSILIHRTMSFGRLSNIDIDEPHYSHDSYGVGGVGLDSDELHEEMMALAQRGQLSPQAAQEMYTKKLVHKDFYNGHTQTDKQQVSGDGSENIVNGKKPLPHSHPLILLVFG